MSARRRLDTELVRRGLVGTRTEAREAIEHGLVTVDGAPALKAARLVAPGEQLHVSAPARAHVSRGGAKLAHALDVLGVAVAGRRCLDAGASTGGFTDCLLQRGAAAVVAVDVGYGQIHERLRADERVTVLERTNVRDLGRTGSAGGPFDLVVGDLSFISLASVLPTLRAQAASDGEAVVLVKPQFEAGRADVGRGGVVRDPAVWGTCLERVVAAGAAVGWRLRGGTASPLLGPAGNVEFLLHLAADGPGEATVAARIERLVEEGRQRRAGSPSGPAPPPADGGGPCDEGGAT